MAVAVGMVEVKGLPPALAAADAMVKAARVTLVGYEVVSSTRFTVIVRGDVSEVRTSVEAGVEAVGRVNAVAGETLLLSYHYIPRPHENIECVLPIAYTERTAAFRV